MITITLKLGLYREFLKGDCQNKRGELFEWCKEHSFPGPQAERIPSPMPDICRKGHHLDVIQTPLVVSGKPREPDNYQPRANVKKKLVKAGSLRLQDLSSIKSFAENFIVAEELVLTAVRHLYENTMAANLCRDDRKTRTRERKEKKFVDYDWKGLIEDRKLDSLFVYELEKYLKRHSITLKKRTKGDKI